MKLSAGNSLHCKVSSRWQVHKRAAGGSQRRGSVASPVWFGADLDCGKSQPSGKEPSENAMHPTPGGSNCALSKPRGVASEHLKSGFDVRWQGPNGPGARRMCPDSTRTPRPELAYNPGPQIRPRPAQAAAVAFSLSTEPLDEHRRTWKHRPGDGRARQYHRDRRVDRHDQEALRLRRRRTPKRTAAPTARCCWPRPSWASTSPARSCTTRPIRQATKAGVPFTKIMLDAGVLPGIKVDLGAEAAGRLPASWSPKYFFSKAFSIWLTLLSWLVIASTSYYSSKFPLLSLIDIIALIKKMIGENIDVQKINHLLRPSTKLKISLRQRNYCLSSNPQFLHKLSN